MDVNFAWQSSFDAKYTCWREDSTLHKENKRTRAPERRYDQAEYQCT